MMKIRSQKSKGRNMAPRLKISGTSLAMLANLRLTGLKTCFYLCALFAIVALDYSISFAEPQRSIKIGVIGPETGEDAETGLMTLAGVELAAKELNDAGGIDGINIEVINYDNKSNPQVTQAAVHKMINEKVIAIIASPTGWSTFAPTWMANEARVIFMSAGSKRHIARSGAFIFRNSLADETATEEIIKYATEKLGYKNYAIITSMRDDETSLSIGGLYRKAVMNKGGKVVSETHIFMDLTMEEAISQLKKDAKAKIDAVIFAGDDVVALDILKELRKQGIKSPLIGGDILYTEEFLKNGKELAVGTLIYSGFFSEAKDNKVERFVSEYKKKTGKKPESFAADAYDSLMLIAEAVKTAKSSDPSKVRDALVQTKNFNGITGKITIGASREAVKKPFTLQVVRDENGIVFKQVDVK